MQEDTQTVWIWRTIARGVTQWVGAMIGAYGISVTSLIVEYALLGESVWWVGMFNSFAHLMWLGALVLLPLALLMAITMRRRWLWGTVLFLLPACVMLVSHYAPHFDDQSALSAPENSLTLRLYTHNIAPRTAQYAGIDALIAEADADIVALQEISHETETYLRQQWGDTYPYMAIYPGPLSPHQGQAVLSRYPILEEAYIQFEGLPYTLGHMRMVLDVEGRDIVVYNVHPTHPGMGNAIYDTQYRTLEITNILELARNEDEPVMLLGDFNLHDNSNDYALITRTYTDVYRAVGWGMGWTFPASSDTPSLTLVNRVIQPVLRLDYAFVDAHFIPLRADVLYPAGGSDHHPVVVEVALLADRVSRDADDFVITGVPAKHPYTMPIQQERIMPPQMQGRAVGSSVFTNTS